MHRHALPRALRQGFTKELDFKKDTLVFLRNIAGGVQSFLDAANGILAVFHHRPL